MSFWQPAGCYSVEVNNDVVEIPPVPDQSNGLDWNKQYNERKRINRFDKRSLSKAFHQCSEDCNHNTKANAFHAEPKIVKEGKSWFQKYAELSLVEVNVESPEVNAVPKMSEDKDFETLTVTVDSGAYNTVGPVKVATHFKVEPTKASQSGQHYRAANGSMIKNYGQRIVSGLNENGKRVGLPIQVADVDKVLGSVREMVNVGNRVVFDKGSDGKCCSYVEHKPTGHKTTIHERNGKFQFDFKTPKGKGWTR